MKGILHLNSYFIDNKLYASLYKKLDKKCRQIVFIPMKMNRSEENAVSLENGRLCYSKIISSLHKFNYWSKINRLVKEVETLNLIEDIDFIHAHNLFNDGAVAYKLKVKYGIDYIVTIRLTDTELQYRFMYQRRPFIHTVLRNAKRIIFISSQSRDSLLAKMPKKLAGKLENKFDIIPNGIDEFWFNNFAPKRDFDNNSVFKLIFVGRIIPLKNIELILEACRILNENKNMKIKLTLVGGESPDDKEYYQGFLEKLKEYHFVDYLNAIHDKTTLRDTYRDSHALVLPSKKELFGIAYMEALSQGLPIIYSPNSGIAPYLEGKNLGYKLAELDVESVCKGIEWLYSHYNEIKIDKEFIEFFDWERISKKLCGLYNVPV